MSNMKKLLLFLAPVAFVFYSCGPGNPKSSTGGIKSETMENKYQVRLITIDPGAFSCRPGPEKDVRSGISGRSCLCPVRS